MKLRYLYFICSVLLASCSATVYSPAMFGHDIAYQPKPMTFDTNKDATYLSGTFGAHQAVNTNDVGFGELNISRAHAFAHGNLAFGAFGFAGQVTDNNYVNDSANTFKFKHISFEGLGLRASGNLNTSFGRTNWRFLGFEAAYSKEFGAYSNFRRQVSGVPGYYSSPTSSLITAGLTTEIIWHGSSSVDNQYGFRVFIGRNFGNLSYLNNLPGGSGSFLLNSSNSFFMQLHHFTATLETNGFLSVTPSLRLTAGYRF